MKYEWKKQEKEFYGAKKSPALVTVPAQNYIMIGGKGNPNDVDFSNRVSALYSLAYAVKMAYKTTAIQNEFNDFTVFPLEGIWQKIEETVLVKENLGYTIMIRQPDFICEDIVKAALEQAKVKKPNPLFDEISFGTMNANRIEISKIKTILRYSVS
ncbi:MAG: small molecule-binding protein [Faecalimonas umbilicata]|uniref:small molecule-binding protein n=1 Tax=Faecalimonas umbilicata TaxID=1912855 RepID=UPI00300E87AC